MTQLLGSDEDLVARIAGGDTAALRRFNTIYGQRIRALAMRVVKNPWDAEEVSQDVLWTIHRKAASFKGQAHPARWINRITVNASLMLIRKRNRAPLLLESEALESLFTAHFQDDPSDRPDEAVVHRRALVRLDDALERQDPTSRHLYRAMEMEGRPKEAVAAELGISVSALKARLHRVRVALRSAVVADSLAA